MMLSEFRILTVAGNTVTQVFIPAAGKGTRVQLDGIQLPKPIRSIGNKPLITRIMDLYPKDTRFLVALGYQGDWVQQVASISARLNEQEIDFVRTESWNTNNQGLTNTLLDAQPKLESQFIFHAVDSIVNSDSIKLIELCEKSSILVAKPQFDGVYRTIKNSNWQKIQFSENETESAYVGVSKIYTDSKFWDALNKQSRTNCEGGETIGIDLAKCEIIKIESDQWLDCGSMEGIQEARRKYQNNDVILERNDEAIWTIQNRMIKFHTSAKFIENRVARANLLHPYVPRVKYDSANVYSYERVIGKTLSKAPENIFEEFLKFCYEFWTSNVEESEIIDSKLKYQDFYQTKTNSRVQEFLKLYPNYNVTEINHQKVASINVLLKKIDWDNLTEITLGRVHGDLHPDNVIYSEQEMNFFLLDWRQDIAGETSSVGDIYYDLAKINHGLIVDHEKISRNEFRVNISENDAIFIIEMTEKKKNWKHEFNQFVQKYKFDAKKIDTLTALIYLNIAALHHDPYSQLLFLLGHDMLNKQQIENIHV